MRVGAGSLSVILFLSYPYPLYPFSRTGLGYLYSGLARRKNALHLLLLTLAALAVTSFEVSKDISIGILNLSSSNAISPILLSPCFYSGSSGDTL